MIPRTSIEEANKHLNLLHGRVGDLEKTVTDQHEALKIKDEQMKSKLAEISSAKNAEIESLLRKLRESEQTVVLLQNQIQHKDDTIAKLQYSLGSVETLLTHKTSVEDLLHAMNMAEKNVKGSGINGSGEPRTHTQGSANRQKDLQQNGYNGSLSSQEEHLDKKSEPAVKSADTKTHRSKRRGGKEFYL